MRTLLWVFCALLAAPALAEGPATLDDIEVYPNRVIFVLDQPVSENVSIMDNPPRLVVDLPNSMSAMVEGIKEGRGSMLEKVEAAEPDANIGGARTVLTLRSKASYRAKWEGGRLTIELLSEDGSPPPPEPPAPPKPAAKPVVKKAPKTKPAAPAVAKSTAAATAPAAAKAAPPAVEKAPAPAAKAAAPAKGGFIIQAGSFSAKKMAEDFKVELEPAVSGWKVSEVTVNGKTFYRLRAGPYADRAAAQAAVDKIAAMGETAVILTNK